MNKKPNLTKEELYLIYKIRKERWGKIEITLTDGRPEIIKIEKTIKPSLEVQKEGVLTKILSLLE